MSLTAAWFPLSLSGCRSAPCGEWATTKCALELISPCTRREPRGADKESCAKCEWTAADENSSIPLPLFSEPYNCCARRAEREREGCRNFIIHAKDIVFCVNVLEREREREKHIYFITLLRRHQ
jgi:hypothetical protein